MPRRPAVRELTGDGSTKNSTPVRINRYGEYKVSIQLDSDGNTTGATVQITLDNPEFTANPAWEDFASLTGVTGDAVASLDFPVEAVRLQLDANGTDTIRMLVTQGGGEY